MARHPEPGSSLVARTNRARAAVERLLDATESLLKEGGLERATVPAIAARSAMAVGNVYKRFADKDALIAAVALRFCQRAETNNAVVLDPGWWRGRSIEAALSALIAGTVTHYVANRRLLAAMVSFVESHPDHRFRRRLDVLRWSALEGVKRLLLEQRDRIRHPDPERAIEFGLTSVACVLRGIVLAPRPSRQYLADPARLARETTRLVLAYLGLEQIPARA